MTLDEGFAEGQRAREDGERNGNTNDRIEVDAGPDLHSVAEREEDKWNNSVCECDLCDEYGEVIIVSL